MVTTTCQERRGLERLDRPALAELQLARLNALLAEILPHNQFYAAKFGQVKLPLKSLSDLASLPLTTKAELAADGAHDMAANRTWPVEQYVRFHRTSGTRGRPLAVLDTAADWQWWIDGWQFVLDAAEVGADDRALMAFSFGPFIGFWSAHDALAARGAMVIPAGGMNSVARLELARTSEATVMLCTPTYALHLAEVAHDNQIDVGRLGVRRIIVAGEPGGSVPAIRRRLETTWNAQVVDHSGATEIGPWGYSDPERRGLLVNESAFVAEFLAVESDQPAAEGELSELVLTTLGRAGAPVIRYRTGDLVRPTWKADGDCRFVLLDGGVLGRADDMMIIRGVNVFPSGVEQILRSFPEVVEYRLTACKRGQMDALQVEVEDRLEEPGRIAKELQLKLGLHVDVALAPLGSLPRFEGKGKRFVDQR
ncbi:MAG: AMP-binding protein [Planctomycetales bacterium]|nr:AMP-binding protein [Planctomycetales bacterium]